MPYIPDSPYPTPVYAARNQVANGPGNVLDVASCNYSRQPPVLQGFIGAGSFTVDIQGSHDNVSWMSYGTFTSDFSRDLIQGIRFWRTVITNYASGSFTANVGAVTDQAGRVVIPNLVTYSNNVPTTAGG